MIAPRPEYHDSGITMERARSLQRAGWGYLPFRGWCPPSDYRDERAECSIAPRGGCVAPGWRMQVGGKLVRE
jgi:hypothetical protein